MPCFCTVILHPLQDFSPASHLLWLRKGPMLLWQGTCSQPGQLGPCKLPAQPTMSNHSNKARPSCQHPTLFMVKHADQACATGRRAPPGLHPAQQRSTSEGRLHAQRINHFVGMMEICRKKALARNMSTMAAIFPKLYTFTPSTLSLPHCIDRALAKLKSGRETFIIKPDASSQASAPSAAQGRPGPSLHMDTLSHARLPPRGLKQQLPAWRLPCVCLQLPHCPSDRHCRRIL